MWQELVKKIELQSVLVLFFTLLFGYLLLTHNNSLSTPAGLLGSVSIAFGILYTFGSFFSNNIKESYRAVISEYISIIGTLRSSNEDVQNYYKNTQTNTGKVKQIGDYETIRENETLKF
jgi:hypothetical protein